MMEDDTAPEPVTPVLLDAAAFAERFLPLFEQRGGPSEAQVEEFVDACYADGVVVVFDWMAWQDQAHVLLETSGAMERTTLVDLQRLLTLLIRQDRLVDGALDHPVQQGWFPAILDRMRTLGA